MLNIAIKPAQLVSGVILVLMLTGCGLTQKVAEGTKSVASSIFYKQIKTLHLDFATRAALNTAEDDSTSLPTVVRIYQLRDRKAFEKADYQSLLLRGDDVLKADLLASREVVVKPGGSASLDMPLEKEANFVAVVGLFRAPDLTKNNWRYVIPREELDPDRPRTLELSKGLTLIPLKD
ncbi:type VI secretion system lipoprotein TssJ [Serratia sp. D1N4]|jgi:type VI secretion system protein VasD